jgi:hypothetical protein
MVNTNFGDDVLIIFKKDKGTTGNLNVNIGETGKTMTPVHSKQGGDGYVTDKNQEALIEKMKAIVEADPK